MGTTRVIRVAFAMVVGVVALMLVGPGRAWAQGGQAVRKEPAKALRVVVTIPPLRGLVQPMLEGAKIPFTMEVLVPPGVSEHGFEAPPSKLAALAQADVVVMVGLGMEPQVEKYLKDRPRESRRVVVAGDAAGIKGDEHAHDDDHDHADHHHHHGSADPHVWLDPVLVEKVVAVIAEQVRGSLGSDSEAVQRLKTAEEEMLRRVREVDAEYRATLSKAPKKTIVVGHDAWGYIENRYGIEAVAINGLTASEPTPSSLEAAMKAIKEKGVTVVFVEPQLGRQAGDRIAKATGVPVRTLDPLGDGDWFAMMRGNLKALAAGLGVKLEEKK